MAGCLCRYNAGFGGNYINTSSSIYAPGTVYFNTSSTGVAGPLVGGQIGYNYQFANRLVIGIESELDYADINRVNSSVGNTTGYAYAGGSISSSSGTSNYNHLALDWLGASRLRFGYAIGSFLPFISGGIAYGQLTSSILSTSTSSTVIGNFYNFAGGSLTSGNNIVTQAGWVLGGGAEYKLADNWSIKGEYFYTSLGGINRNDVTIGTNGLISFTQNATGSFNIHQARVGLNYHTGWLGGGAPTVTAKY